MKKCALYVRVSTIDQAEEGYSISEQEDKLRKYCEVRDWTVYQVYTDGGFTGSNIDRPALTKLIEDAEDKKFDTVLVYKLDRLSRSQKNTLYLIEDVFNRLEIGFLSLQEQFDTTTPFGKAMIGILSVFAQLEREQIKERMQLGKLGRAKSGKIMSWSKNPYGYNYNQEASQLEIIEEEAEIVKYIYKKYLDGIPIRRIQISLNEMQLQTSITKWWPQTIKRILSNPVYIGKQTFKDEIFEATHQAIISEENFNQVQDEIKRRQLQAYNKNPDAQRPFQSKYLLSGLLKCGYCNAPLQIQQSRINKLGIRSMRYSCVNRNPVRRNVDKACISGSYKKEDIEKIVISEISKLKTDKSYLEKLLKNNKHDNFKNNNYQAQIKKLDDKLSKLNDLYINDLISIDEIKSKSLEIKNNKQKLEKLSKNEAISREENLKSQHIVNEVLNFTDIYSLSESEQKKIVNALIEKIKVTEKEVKIIWRF